MAALLYSATMSLDGFIAGPGGDMSWLNRHPGEWGATAASLHTRIGCLLVGGRTFRGDDPNAGTDSEGAFGGQYTGMTVVLTSTPPPDPIPGVEFEDDLLRAVERSRELAGGRYVNVLGAATAQACLRAGLLDEILLFVAPVLLGGGTRAFADTGDPEVRLEKISDTEELWFRVVR
ncbi:dihydrofolate reductase family protein [Ornithinimicrobium cavernae]|uniref:dihydrofolate reductase family protein n=1 Tax=Ornithinimicrobium cavernae TaxID=2666047 RepID=UPI000D698D9F|nr:dihydrofolate reductase family protein [Ornithinimicrobium cavernae]